MKCFISDQAEADLEGGRDWIKLDNPEAAVRLIETALECFDRLAQFPETGAAAKIAGREFSSLRFMVLAPPFNRWIVFYNITSRIEIVRVLYGVQNWRNEPRRFF